MESVWDYPRPPRLERVPARITIEFAGTVIADTTEAWRILETSHPPTYYLPPDDIVDGVLEPAGRGSICEWKGAARYWTVRVGDRVAERVAWSYPNPVGGYADLKDHVAFYCGPMDRCTVGGVEAEPQPGGFYGGWITPDVTGPFQGRAGHPGLVSVGTLLLVLGDQLDDGADALEALDPERDAVWMAEVDEEITSVPSHKRRIAVFLASMRHFRDRLRERGYTVHYHALGPDPDDDRGVSFAEVLAADLARVEPDEVVVTLPGDHRVKEALTATVAEHGLDLRIAGDRHFWCEPDAFARWLNGRKRILLEDFYRWMRRRHDILLDDDGTPVGGEWNYDDRNRESFDADGPGDLPRPPRFEPDEVTQEVLDLIQARWPDHPGRLDGFAEPVTPDQARAALDAFVRDRLPRFGRFQDALWKDEPELFHARLSAVLNLKLLDPRDCVEAALTAFRNGDAPLNAVEGFVRQILGWREYVRGLYWRFMPDYADRNALECDDRDVPAFFWDGETDMACVADAMEGVLALGYAHHIQRLMVLGLFALLSGVHPHRFHLWHMALYIDAVDWVSLPNTLGMSQFGDGGIVGTKPYCASGKYIQRQGNLCAGCRYDPAAATGDDACPFTTLYWDFLMRNRDTLESVPRMGLQLRNVDRKSDDERTAIRERAAGVLERVAAGERI